MIIDATPLDLYPVGKPGFNGGTELYVQKLAQGLAGRGHTVHVVTPDLEEMEQRAPTEFWWPKNWHPTTADAVVMVHNLEHISPYSAELLILASNGLGADLGPDDAFASGLDAVACFSQVHVDLLTKRHPKIDAAKCHVTGLGVELNDYGYHTWWHQIMNDPAEKVGEWRDIDIAKVPGRILWANDPQRGLWHAIEIFEHVQREIPGATLHVAYDWLRVFDQVKWGASHLVERLWECQQKIEANDGIVNLGALSREQVIREQLECQIHAMPSDPPNVGSQIHGITQLECAAAGAALVLSDLEAFPEVFGEGAEILPVPGWFDPRAERRWDAQDWADVVVGLMKDPEKWAEASTKARALAERNTWETVIDKWDALLAQLSEKGGQS